jgi:transposase
MPRPKGSADLLEYRRHRALTLLDAGRSLNEVSRLIGCAASSVMRWRDRRRRGGTSALKVRTSPGRPPKLSAVQRRRLVQLLLRGAMAHGHSTELWTTRRIAALIKKHFLVTYHRDHVGRLMHSLDWSHQKPERRAVERDKRAITEWKRKTWARVKQTPQGWAPTSSSPTNRASS